MTKSLPQWFFFQIEQYFFKSDWLFSKVACLIKQTIFSRLNEKKPFLYVKCYVRCAHSFINCIFLIMIKYYLLNYGDTFLNLNWLTNHHENCIIYHLYNGEPIIWRCY